MTTDKLFMGTALCKVEFDGTMLLPEFVRVSLAARSNESGILLGSHEVDACVTGYDPAQALALQEECRRRRIAEEASRPGASHARDRRVFGLLHAIEVDADGRCVLPDLLRRRARIRDKALIVGTGDSFEIWSAQVALYGHDTGMRALAALSLEAAHAA